MMVNDEHSFRRNNSEQILIFKYRFTPTYRRSCVFMIVIIFIWISLLNYNSMSKYKENLSLKLPKKPSIPTLARNLYLFICENQAEVDAYMQIFPSVTADAIFYCWRENCNSSRFRSSLHLYINTWSSKTKRNEKLISLQPISSFHYIQSRIFIINEKELNPKQKLTWTTARNKLYEVALNEERNQNWRWSFYTFSDGDVHVVCPLAEQLLTNKTIVDYGNNEEYLLAPHFYSFISLTHNLTGEHKCFLLHDAFLFSISPAIATISGENAPIAFPGLLTQVYYHIDAMFNAIHRDALPFLLPYCPRYDARSWWTSQAIFVYRSLCVYGHILGFDAIYVAQRKHRSYPRAGDPWAIDDDMNLVPDYLLPLKDYMKQNRLVSPLDLNNYAGWNLELTSKTCRYNHTAMKLDTCLVYGDSSYV